MTNFLELAKDRYSVRKFTDKQVEQEKLNIILEAGNVAPTAVNYQPQKIYVLQSEDALAKAKSVCPCTYDAKTILLFAYDDNQDWDNPKQSGIHSGQQDVSIVATHIMLAAWDNAFQKIDHVTSGVFIWNGIWTFFLTLVPFATRWVGEHPNDTLPEFLYILVLFAWSLMFQLMDNRIIKDFPGTKPDATNNRKTRLPMYIGYAVAMIVSFFLPIATLILILVMVAAMTVGIFRMMHADKK